MLNLGTGELLVVFLVALLVLGPSKLPDAARQMGRMVAELRRLSTGFQDEMRAAMQDPTPTLPPLLDADAPAAIVQTSAMPASSEPAGTTPRRRRAPLRADDARRAETARE
ncbi:MAG: sec-independent protein translocase protein TatB [Actinomycetota bacterium]